MTNDFINSFNLISHSEPDRKLVVHLNEVYQKSKNRFNELQINFKFLNISKDEFEELLKIIIYCHDFGKSSIYFQKKITQGLSTVEEKRLSEHGLISAFFGYFVAIQFDKRLSSFVFMAIRYHHLNLDNSEEMQKVKVDDIEKVLEIFEEGIKPNSSEIDRIYEYFLNVKNITNKFEEFLNSNFPEEEIDSLVMYFWYKSDYEDNDIFIFMLLFSLLIYSDKQDAIFRDKKLTNITNLKIDSNKVEEFKNSYFETKEKTPLDETREKIYQTIINEFQSKDEDNQLVKNKKIFFVKLPTGAGKTLLLYKLAMMIQESKSNQKVFYLLPFITLIEQNANILKNLLSFMDIDSYDNRIFLEKHSLSGEFELNDSVNEYDIDAKEFLLDTLESKFIVTSFHQLFYGVFKRKNAMLKRFHQFSNSIILIDEIQLIPLEHMYIVSKFLKFMSEIFNCKIIVASATFPNITEDILNDTHTFKDINKILTENEINTFFNRYEIKIDISKVYSGESLYKKIDEKIYTKKDLLFRVNTVNIANEIYEYLISINSDYSKKNIFLLTSAVAPRVRKCIIKKIKRNSKKGIKQIVVATQLIQAGVDISLEDGFEELAPFDLIVQSMGRRNRSAEKKDIGRADIIKIAKVINNKEFEGHKIYNQYDIQQTVYLLNQYETLNEKEIYNYKLLDTYYSKQVEVRKIDREFKNLNFKNIDENFILIKDAPLSFSFFIPLDKKAEYLWQQLLELDKKKRNIQEDKFFWKNMKDIENKYSKIKKDISLYVVNQNFYYYGSEKETAIFTITEKFDKALGIYLANKDVFDKQKGLQLVDFVKNKVKGLFW
jgi:CRISPR-associated endonuclease/helicase Cas3